MRGWVFKSIWTQYSEDLVRIFNQIFVIQICFGFTLWLFASPIVHAALLHPSMILHEPIFFFWAVRHPLTMIAALGVFHVGKYRARFAPDSAKHRTYSLTLGFVILIIFSAIPWPIYSYGRALFRGF